MLWMLLVFEMFAAVHSDTLPDTGTCLCVGSTNVPVDIRYGGKLLAQAATGECGIFAGHTKVYDGLVWYQFSCFNGHENVLAYSSKLEEASESYCGNACLKERFAPGIVSIDCLKCICNHESKCQSGCALGASCGYFRITKLYWEYCRKLKENEGGWTACANDRLCSSQCVQNYVKRNIAHSDCPRTCEGYAKIHYGGRDECHTMPTSEYWRNLIRRQPDCQDA